MKLTYKEETKCYVEKTFTLWNSALHVSGDEFAHPQEHFLTVYTAFGTMHRHCCRPVPRLRWNVSSISTVTPVCSRGGALYQKLYIQSRSAPEDGRIFRPKHVGVDLKRLIKEKVVASCWLFSSLYWWCTVTQTSSLYLGIALCFLRNTTNMY